MDKQTRTLRRAILRSLRKQGFVVDGDSVTLACDQSDKDYLRKLHELSTRQKIATAETSLRRHEDALLNCIADGSDVIPEAISPRLKLVQSDSFDELLFRYATLHWSIPVSSGYGRRMRFVVYDESNGKLIGVIGLGDPVAALGPRDTWIGWTREQRENRLYHVMDAYVLGAVPPYSQLLGGKLVAMLALSNHVRGTFARKYRGNVSRIREEQRVPHLALITTTSALGRSSLYNRLRTDGVEYWSSIGFTKGSGEFQFSNGVYARIREFAEEHGEPSWRHENWGDGFRNRREIVRQCLAQLGFPRSLGNHGIRREVFVAPLGTTAREYLQGEARTPEYHDWTEQHLFEVFKQRWLLPRAERQRDYADFRREGFRIWPARRKG